jgi:Xaa-Pro dipeptidase
VVAFDEYPMPLHAELGVSGLTLGDATPVLGAAKVCKTFDELACIREAQRINEAAMDAVRPLVRPGVRQSRLTGAFLRRIRELGMSANCVDPVWQVMPARVSSGPYSATGDVVFPTASTDRILRDGDVIWTDTGCSWNGYASDHGRTWLVSRDPVPDAHQLAQYRRWRDVVDRVLEVTRPGATGGDLVRAACAGESKRPWLPHFYLVHGIGTEPAEAPLIGTDLGAEFDESIVLAPGMVMVLEPVVWEHGHAGYRAEDVVAVTDTGWVALSHDTYAPYPDD